MKCLIYNDDHFNRWGFGHMNTFIWFQQHNDKLDTSLVKMFYLLNTNVLTKCVYLAKIYTFWRVFFYFLLFLIRFFFFKSIEFLHGRLLREWKRILEFSFMLIFLLPQLSERIGELKIFSELIIFDGGWVLTWTIPLIK